MRSADRHWKGGIVWVKANLLYLFITPGVQYYNFCVHYILIGTLDKPATPSDWRRHNIYFSLFLFVSPQWSRVLLSPIRSEAASPPKKDGRLFKTCYFFNCFFSYPASDSEYGSWFFGPSWIRIGSTAIICRFCRRNLSSVQMFIFCLTIPIL